MRGLVTGVQHDYDHPSTADKVQTVTRAVVNPHFGNFAFDWLPIAQTASPWHTAPTGLLNHRCRLPRVDNGSVLTVKVCQSHGVNF